MKSGHMKRPIIAIAALSALALTACGSGVSSSHVESQISDDPSVPTVTVWIMGSSWF